MVGRTGFRGVLGRNWSGAHCFCAALAVSGCTRPSVVDSNGKRGGSAAGGGETGLAGGSGDSRVATARELLAPVASVVSTDAWLDLLSQRPSAVTTKHGRLIIDFSQEDARRHFSPTELHRWSSGAVFGGRSAGSLREHGASIFVPLDDIRSPALASETGLAMALTVRSDLPDQVMTVLWNEHPVVNLQVGATWRRRTVSIPLEHASAGENRLRLHFRKSGTAGGSTAEIELLELGATEMIRKPLPDANVLDVIPRRDGDVNLTLAAGGGLAYYFVPPRRGRLVIEASGEGSLEVFASTDLDHGNGRAPRQLTQAALRPTGQQLEVDLSGYGGVPTRLELRVRDTRGADAPGAMLKKLEVRARRSIPVDRRKRVPRDIVIFAVEGFRGDELAPERLASGEFPALSQFRKEALSFGVAYAPGAAAVPSHAALQSSVVPAAHLTGTGTFVAQSWTVLAEVLERAGYSTQLVTANPYVSQARGLVQGMGDVKTLTSGPVRANTATHVVSTALPQERTRKFPSLSYLVMNDPQAPYDPPKAFLRGLTAPEGAPAQHLTHMWVGRVRRGRDVTQEERRYVRSLYRGELQLVDVALGNTLESLASSDRLQDAVIVVVGIHGEEFLEHDGAGHGLRLFEESLRVPVLIWAPELLAPGEVSVPVDLLDLAPTLLDLVGIEAPADWQGRSWVSVIDDPQPPPQIAAASLGDGSFMLRAHDLKVQVGSSVGSDGIRLYDLALDPGERMPVEAGGGIGMRMMRTAATWHQLEFGRWKRLRWGTAVNLLPAFALDHGM